MDQDFDASDEVDDGQLSDEDYEDDAGSDKSEDACHFSDNVFADYSYSDVEYDTDDELALYRNTQLGQNAAPADAAGKSSIQNLNPASQNRKGSPQGRLSNTDQIPNK